MTLNDLDRAAISRMQAWGPSLLRCGLGLVFLWFGALKLFPGVSPAEDLVRRAVPFFDGDWFVPALGAAEMLIGLCLWNRRWTRFGLILMAGHMLGAALPLVTLPEVTWRAFPVATLEGQYILKNIVLVAAAVVLGGMAGAPRGRRVPRRMRSFARSAPCPPREVASAGRARERMGTRVAVSRL